MDKVKVIEIKRSVYESNDREADKLRSELKEKGIWITGADLSGDRSLYDADLKGAVAIVIGSEGKGMSRLVKEKCDFLVKIPMKGKLESLNASVAAALMIYEAARNRL